MLFEGREETKGIKIKKKKSRTILEYHRLKQFKSNGNQTAFLQRIQLLLHLFIIIIYGKCIKLSSASWKIFILFFVVFGKFKLFSTKQMSTCNFFSFSSLNVFFRKMHGLLHRRHETVVKTKTKKYCALYMRSW